MANLVLASLKEVKSGSQMWHVYRNENGNKSDEFYFAQDKAMKALRYAFILRKRHGAIIPKAIYNKLYAAAKSGQAEPTEQAPESK